MTSLSTSALLQPSETRQTLREAVGSRAAALGARRGRLIGEVRFKGAASLAGVRWLRAAAGFEITICDIKQVCLGHELMALPQRAAAGSPWP